MKAVCVLCGKPKWGALTVCRHCQKRPESLEDQARSMLASEDTLDDAGLEALGERIAAGESVEFDAEQLAAMRADLEKVPRVPLWFALLIVALPVGVLGGLMLVAARLLAG